MRKQHYDRILTCMTFAIFVTSCSVVNKNTEAPSRVKNDEPLVGTDRSSLNIANDKIAMVRYKFFAINADGSTGSEIKNLANSSPKSPNISIKRGSKIIIRTQMLDLRSQPLGIFSAYHNMNLVNPDNAASRRLTLDWGEYTQLEIPKSTVAGGRFVVKFGARETPPIAPVFVRGSISQIETASKIRDALAALSNIGVGNIRVNPIQFAAGDSDFKFGISFTGNKSITDVLEVFSVKAPSLLRDRFGKTIQARFLRSSVSLLDPNVTSVARRHTSSGSKSYSVLPAGVVIERDSKQPFDTVASLGGVVNSLTKLQIEEVLNSVDVVDVRFVATAAGVVKIHGTTLSPGSKLGIGVFESSSRAASKYLTTDQLVLPEGTVNIVP